MEQTHSGADTDYVEITKTGEHVLKGKITISHNIVSYIMHSRHVKFGLVFGDRHHLLYVWNDGALQWLPHGITKLVVSMWNFVVCAIGGHEPFGPIRNNGIIVVHKSCIHCNKRFPDN